MERYEKEVRTGHLNWGLLHTDKFWKENFMAFENKEFELIRCVESSSDRVERGLTVLACCCPAVC